MGKYKKCPRCDLNYILSEEDYCDICKIELGLESNISLLDDSLEEEDAVVLCPVCKVNTMGVDDEMCRNCLSLKHEREEADDDGGDWQEFLEDEPDELLFGDVDIPLDELVEDEEDDDMLEDEEEFHEADDFDDSYFAGGNDDFDDDDDDDDDDDEF